jgi:membrane protease subunit HflK
VAYKYLDETVNLARGEATRQLEIARGQSVGQVLRAEGDSRSLQDRAEAYRLHRVGTYTRLYLETVESVLTNATKVIRPGWGASGNIDLWLSSGGQPIPVKDVLRGSQAGANDRTKAGE